MLKLLLNGLGASLFLLAGTGCSSIACRLHDGQSYQVADSVFCGTAMPNGGVVSPKQWQAFVVKEVTPRFPKSMTSWHASGQWLTEAGVLEREKSFVLYLVHPDTAQDDRYVHEIMDAYRKAFNQEAVLQVRSKVLVYLDQGKKS